MSSLLNMIKFTLTLFLDYVQKSVLDQGILKGEVSLYYWPPAWLVWNQLYDSRQFLLLFAKQTNPNQSNRRSTVQCYFPLFVFPAEMLITIIINCLDQRNCVHVFLQRIFINFIVKDMLTQLARLYYYYYRKVYRRIGNDNYNRLLKQRLIKFL